MPSADKVAQFFFVSLSDGGQRQVGEYLQPFGRLELRDAALLEFAAKLLTMHDNGRSPIRAAGNFADLFPHGRVVVVPESSHCPSVTAHGTFVETVEAFLS
jgi:pimeloyl-ACP methyl ester carboxylesterase